MRDDGRRLYRSRDAMILGVCRGLADYFGVSQVLVLLAGVMFALGYWALRAYRGRIWGEPPTPQSG